jgi:hypothetical protein
VRPALVYPLYWRVRKVLGERHGQRCRVLVRSRRMNMALVEFADGYRCITSRNYFRRVQA